MAEMHPASILRVSEAATSSSTAHDETGVEKENHSAAFSESAWRRSQSITRDPVYESCDAVFRNDGVALEKIQKDVLQQILRIGRAAGTLEDIAVDCPPH